jgi:hypothetical protein
VKRSRKAAFLVAASLTLAEAAVVARRRGSWLGAETVVRCRSGHLFTTIWIPGGSLKAIRLGPWRLQYCPVGGHWTLVTPAQASGLAPDERQSARRHHDLPIP